jgi:Penicillin-insensitive murein endopeptidase
MGWRSGEVWFDADVLWFHEQPRGLGALAVAGGAIELPRFDTGLEASRRRRFAAETARKRRFSTRTVPAVAVVVGSSVVIPVSALRQRGGAYDALPVPEDPPSLTFRLESPFLLSAPRPEKPDASTAAPPRIAWRTASAHGLPYSGHLHDATQLPLEGPDWVTWNPSTDSRPNLPGRLYGHERTIRTVIEVLAAYRKTHPEAPLVVVGDISFRTGGVMDQHVSHQNGLDVDVYYPRRDGWLQAPRYTAQIDRRLSQALLDGFVAAGASKIFVGYSTDLRGPHDVVVPYPNHENHMHVRFRNPG